MNGRFLVIILLAAAVAAAGGAVWFRHRSRAPLVSDLADPSRRGRALGALLRMNKLWGLDQDFVHAGGASPGGHPYLRALTRDGSVRHLVAGIKTLESGEPHPACFVFDPDGRLEQLLDGARLLWLAGPEAEAVAGALRAAAGSSSADSHEILVLEDRFEKALEVRGSFQLETPGGIVRASGNDSAPGKDSPAFQYDASAGCFRGAPGGPDQPWEVHTARSPRYCPMERPSK